MKFPIVAKHFEVLRTSVNEPSGWPSGSPVSWYDWVKKHSGKSLLPNSLPETADRITIQKMVSDSAVDIQSCCLAILAWGGMNRMHGAKLLGSGEDWLRLSDEIRNGKLGRMESYERFSGLRKRNMLPGMGPAYFTKLIFFLSSGSKEQGLIMDQWTSASVNLLSGHEIVKTHRSRIKLKNGERIFETVSDNNTSENYENYCQYVEHLASPTKLNISPDRVEELLFSSGRGKGKWRNHVVKFR